jgi:hypothetical protein
LVAPPAKFVQQRVWCGGSAAASKALADKGVLTVYACGAENLGGMWSPLAVAVQARGSTSPIRSSFAQAARILPILALMHTKSADEFKEVDTGSLLLK